MFISGHNEEATPNTSAAGRPERACSRTDVSDHARRFCYCWWEGSTCLLGEITLVERRLELFGIVADAPPLMEALNLAAS